MQCLLPACHVPVRKKSRRCSEPASLLHREIGVEVEGEFDYNVGTYVQSPTAVDEPACDESCGGHAGLPEDLPLLMLRAHIACLFK